MYTIEEKYSRQELECPCSLSWLLLGVAFVPHLQALVGSNWLSAILACACFPASMGPFSLIHAYFLVHRLEFTSHMAWISAMLCSLIWSTFLYYSWQKSRGLTMTIGVCCFVVSAGLVWLFLVPA